MAKSYRGKFKWWGNAFVDPCPGAPDVQGHRVVRLQQQIYGDRMLAHPADGCYSIRTVGTGPQ